MITNGDHDLAATVHRDARSSVLGPWRTAATPSSSVSGAKPLNISARTVSTSAGRNRRTPLPQPIDRKASTALGVTIPFRWRERSPEFDRSGAYGENEGVRSRLVPALAAAAALMAAPPATAAPRCTAGKTLYAKGGARIFYVEREEAVFGCRRRTGRAKLLVYSDPTYGSFSLLKRVGTVVPFLDVTSGEGGGYANELGWFDTRTGRSALARPFLPEAELEVLDLAVAQDGTTAVISREAEDDAVVSLHRAGRRGRLGAARGLAFVRGRYVRRSVRLGPSAVTWRDESGARSVPLSGEPLTCAAGRSKLGIGAVRIFEALDQARNRGALHWCGPAAASPQPLTVERTRSWPLRPALTVSAEVSGRLAFAGEGIAGVAAADTGAVRSVAVARELNGVAPAPGGDLVAAYDTPNGQIDAGILVAPPSGTNPFALGPPQLVATYRGKLEPGSLAVAGDTIGWKTEKGARSVPLGGETAVGCTVGTTLDETDGVRIFEVLSVANRTRTLYACRPDGAGPLSLLTQAKDTPFPHWFVGLRNGRGALVRWGDRERDPDKVLTFATTQESLRTGTIPSDSRAIAPLDLDIGTDGAVAFMLGDRDGGEVEVHFMAPTPSGLADARRVTRRKGGYKRRTLTVTDTEIRWQEKDGDPVTVARP